MNFLDFDDNIVFLSFSLKKKNYNIKVNEKELFLWL